MVGSVPDWLLEHPSSLPGPPIVTREQGLPFERLSWPDFERLIQRIVASDREVLDCRVYGVPGQAQHGIDLLGAPLATPSKLGCFQCKKVEAFGAPDIEAAIALFEQGPWVVLATEFTLCVAASLEDAQSAESIVNERARLAERGVTLHVWDASPAGELNARLKSLPKIVDDFFGRGWVRAFNGPEAAEGLGDRLDGIDFAVVRERLHELYRIIFTRHDPGLRFAPSNPSDYAERFVPPDVTESARVEQRDGTSRSALDSPSVNGEPIAHAIPQDTRSESKGAASERAVRRPVFEWLRGKGDCAVVGEPGHGKSALLRHLALALSVADSESPSPLGAARGRRLPVWISFVRFATALKERPALSIADFFCMWLHQFGYDDIQPLFLRAVRDAEVALFIDGLDEAADAPHGPEALDRVITYAASSQAIVVCSSRPRGLASLPLPASWPVATLAPLSDVQIEELATRWLALSEGTAAGQEPREARLTRARPRGEAFLAAVRAGARTHELARNPLLCQALIELFRLSHRLPEARARAYEEIIDLFLRRHPQARAHAGAAPPPRALDGMREADLRDILMTIASDTQIGGAGGITSRARCEELCASYLEDDIAGLGMARPAASRRAPDVIALLVDHFGVLVERSPGELSFAHLSLQEFLVAKAVAKRADESQIDWIRALAFEDRWQECVRDWFGIQGTSGRRDLTFSASRAIADRGNAGEWERLRSLHLRAELAAADLGLPVSEARAAVADAINEVDVSPHAQARRALGRSVALGALGGPVMAECEAAIVRWAPARRYYERALVLDAMGNWEPAEDLAATLTRAMRSEEVECRRAAAKAYVRVFGSRAESLEFLTALVRFDERPEIRAAALLALGEREEWRDAASAAATWNIGSNADELLLCCVAARVQSGRHEREDLQRLLRMLWADSLDVGLSDQLHGLIREGWPQEDELRARFLRMLEREQGMADLPFPIEWLSRGYPGDAEVGDAIARQIDRYGLHLGFGRRHIWEAMAGSFAGHAPLVQAARRALAKHRERYSLTHWDPMVTPLYLVLADDAARDELIEGYESADPHGRYWVASTLVRGWATDPCALSNLKRWGEAQATHAAPLAAFGEELRPDRADRIAWLERLVAEADSRIVIRPIRELLDAQPDARTRDLVAERLARPELWYYNRMEIESHMAAAYPEWERSAEIVNRAFSENDGPSLGPLAAARGAEPAIRARLLAVAAPAATDARLSVAAALTERGGDPDLIERLTPTPLAEATSAARAAALIARGRALRRDSLRAPALIETLAEEATATGSMMDQRRRTAIAALLSMGQARRVAEVLAQDKSGVRRGWTDALSADAISIGAIIDHWPELASAAAERGVDLALPVAELVYGGYASFLEAQGALRSELEEGARAMRDDWGGAERMELQARLHPRSSSLRAELIAALSSENIAARQAPIRALPRGRHACLAARLLGAHFGGDEDALVAILPPGPAPALRSGAPGVLGHLIRSWPGSTLERAARDANAEERDGWAAIDRLLCATAWEQWEDASAAAAELLALRYRHRYIPSEDNEALTVWARSEGAPKALVRWRESSEGDEAVAALALMQARGSLSHSDREWLRLAFNSARADRSRAPLDGRDPFTGRVVGWAQRAYEALASEP